MARGEVRGGRTHLRATGILRRVARRDTALAKPATEWDADPEADLLFDQSLPPGNDD